MLPKQKPSKWQYVKNGGIESSSKRNSIGDETQNDDVQQQSQ